jgi:hypothetical protein
MWSWLNRSGELWHDGGMSQHPSEHLGPDGQNEVTQAALPPAGVEIATPVSRGQVLRVMALLTVAFLVGALLLRVQADRIRPLDLPLPAGWEAVSADTVLAGISPQSAVRAARTADAPVGASPRVRLITLTTAGSDAPSLSGVYWLIVTDDVRPSMEIPIGDSLDVIRAIVLVDQRGGIALAVERGFSNADPTLPPD